MAVNFFNDTRFYRLNIKLGISECYIDESNDRSPPSVSEWSRLGAEFSSWVRENVLHSETRNSDAPSSGCTSISDYDSQIDLHSGLFFSFVLVVLTTLVTPLIIANVLDFCDKKDIKTEEAETHDEPFTEDQIILAGTAQTSKTQPGNIPLYNVQYHSSHNALGTGCDLPSFLKRTVDCLFQELDKLLIEKNPGQSDGPLHSTVTSSVRLPRRPVLRTTGRRSSSPLRSSRDTGENSTETFALREFQQHIIYNNVCTNMFLPESLAQSLQGNNRRLYEFCTSTCAVNFEQLTVSNFIVNYTVHLLDKVLKTMSPYHGLRYVSCFPTGSVRKGTKVGTANQSDVSFLFQCSDIVLLSAIDHKMNSDVPPGKIVLLAVDNENHEVPSKLLKIYEDKKCISPQEFLNAACELTEIALQKLYKEGRPMIDRLPFRIQRASSPGLYLSLDTRNVVGFHCSDIRVQLIPSLLMSTNKWIDPVNVYAVPTWSNVDVKRKVAPRDRYATQPLQATSHDLYWCMSFGELEHFFFNKMDQKSAYSGVLGCHKTVIQILKFLFAPQSRKTLLSRGEVSSYMIETVVSYMLVESRAEQWAMDQLSARVSDAIHFLKRALQNGRLPNFYINNPHLAGESDFLKHMKFLFPGRQENLMADGSDDTVSKMLHFLDSRLAEYNLSDCVRPEYSEDMWEYEYFVYL